MDQLKHRKAETRLQLQKPDGTPAGNQSVRIDQVSHQFLFGCGAFDAVELMRTRGDEAKQAVLQERLSKWLGLFNYGTLPFYWGRYEPVEGQTAYPETMAAAKWLHERGAHTVSRSGLCQPCVFFLHQHTSCIIILDIRLFRGMQDLQFQVQTFF